jgi:polyphosphate kinase
MSITTSKPMIPPPDEGSRGRAGEVMRGSAADASRTAGESSRHAATEAMRAGAPDASRAAPADAPAASSPPALALDDPARFLNRELQWLEFNDRVLHQAADEGAPLLERVRFLAIFSSNLDEFFMKRVGGIRRQLEAGVQAVLPDNIHPARLLADIRQRVLPMIRHKDEIYRQQLLPKLREIGIHLAEYKDLADADRQDAESWYRRNVFPILTPLAVDPGHRFPFISNLSTSLGVMLRRPGDAEVLFARVKVPEVLPQWYEIGRSRRFVLLQDIIEHNLDDLFPGMEILKVLPFRVTRNADVERDYEDADDLLSEIQEQLRERRFAPVVRLQIGRKPNKRLLQFLCEEMEIAPDDIYETQSLLNFRSLEQIASLPMPEHRYRPWTPLIPPRLADEEQDIFSVIRKGDVMVHHPYESFDASVERFIIAAASDPKVLCIKQALYRTSEESAFIPQLIRAAEAGKQVAVLVELRARFDEARNIIWARRLEDAGVHVVYGVVGLKTHTKIALVVRQEGDRIVSYGHIGTGNYNSKTARIYEDIGLLTANPLITDDLVSLFNYMTGRSRQREYHKLLVAPVAMKQRFIELIEREVALHRSGRPGCIIAKMNQLQDREVIDSLYRASQAGVQVDLIVRGFCTLRPGLAGLSENIRLCSVVGRFLEHSRIFWFASGEDDPLAGEYYIGSADWMYRNLNNRVECAAPIEDRALRQRLWQILQICLNDQRQCWDMRPDGSYALRSPRNLAPESAEALGTHVALMQLSLQYARELDRLDSE